MYRNKEDILKDLNDIVMEVIRNRIKESLNETDRNEIMNTGFGRGLKKSLNDPKIIQALERDFGHQFTQKIIQSISSDISANYKDINEDKAYSMAYSILEIAPDSTDEQIKKRYKQLVQEYHPDKASQATDGIKKLAQEKVILINRAYECIRTKRGLL